MAKVKISGSRPYLGMVLEEDDPSIVKLTDGWYNKKDPSVICIKNRFYRKNSPLLAELAPNCYGEGNMVLKEDAVEYEGMFYLKRDCSTESILSFNPFKVSDLMVPVRFMGFPSVKLIQEDGNLLYCRVRTMTPSELEKYLVRSLTGGQFLVEDPNFIIVNAAIKSDSVRTPICDGQRKIHSSELKWCLDSKFVFKIGEDYWWHTALVFTTDYQGNKITPMCSTNQYKMMSAKERESLLLKFCIKENRLEHQGQKSFIERIIFGVNNTMLIDKSMSAKSSDLHYNEELNIYSEENFTKAISDYEKSGKSLEVSAPVLENNYFDQPKPLLCTPFARNEGGNYLFHESSDRKMDISGGKILTGNCGYTFGVEIETSVGLLPKVLVEKLSLKGIGDRSIGAVEYVTKPLYGNKGILLLKETIKALSRYTAVDKRCGIHIHVGGSGIDESPAFNRSFSLHAVKLGCMIESEMFEIVPPQRTESKNREGMSYCGRFASQFSEISKENWKEMLGNFVFGHPYSDEHNKKTRLSRWVNSRYKWLNLVNCNSNNEGRSDAGRRTAQFETIEFRLWDGSLVWEDVYAFVIISMAFTKFVENHQRKIMKYNEISISEVVYSTMRKNVAEEVIQWIEKRKEKVKKLTNKK